VCVLQLQLHVVLLGCSCIWSSDMHAREIPSEESVCVCFTALLSALLALLRAEKKRNSEKPVALRRLRSL
jgi:hypothetical protein